MHFKHLCDMEVAIIGGGAAGFFAAITCAETHPEARVFILERGNAVLQKVRVSGGGRCNATHACFDARELVRYYPRGNRELLGPFMRFGPEQTIEWFEARGVPLKTEADGRMFPTTDDSQTIIDCLTRAAARAGVRVETGVRVEGLERTGERWRIRTAGGERLADAVIITTGSSERVWEWLAALGHRIVPPAPSLFTFNTKDTRLRDLAGVSAPAVTLRIPAMKLEASGPLLVTHWGLSGPAVLRLSAWGARLMQDCGYKFALTVNWTGLPLSDVQERLKFLKQENARKTVLAHAFFELPLRLWQRLCEAAGVPPDLRWADMSGKTLQRLAEELAAGQWQINGKSTFKEEFVTAGGVDLRDVDFKTFASKVQPNLYFAGEVLDIDALTGGFNFQAAWTGGWIAGRLSQVSR
jgi:predicted Rossmann fold flavoprotein